MPRDVMPRPWWYRAGQRRRAEELGLGRDQIVLSCKMSGVQDLIAVYRELARRCDYALHLGLTEAGMGTKGIVASTAALAVLLQEGIGDTIRISLTPEPGGDRTEEVRGRPRRYCNPWGCGLYAPGHRLSRLWPHHQHLLPGTGPGYPVLSARHMPRLAEAYPGVENLNVAVMGCIVNGPGESKHANIGISLPGTGEHPAAPVFIDGEKKMTLKGDRIAEEFKAILDDYVITRYGAG